MTTGATDMPVVDELSPPPARGAPFDVREPRADFMRFGQRADPLLLNRDDGHVSFLLVRPFPPESDAARNIEAMDPPEWLARTAAPIPDPGRPWPRS